MKTKKIKLPSPPIKPVPPVPPPRYIERRINDIKVRIEDYDPIFPAIESLKSKLKETGFSIGGFNYGDVRLTIYPDCIVYIYYPSHECLKLPNPDYKEHLSKYKTELAAYLEKLEQYSEKFKKYEKEYKEKIEIFNKQQDEEIMEFVAKIEKKKRNEH